MDKLFYFIYRIPLDTMILIILFTVAIWGLTVTYISGRSVKTSQIINGVLVAAALTGILYITVFRQQDGQRMFQLIPFHSFIEALEQREMYRSVLMNIALFVPFGLTAPYVLCKTKKPVIYAILAAFSLSLIIEIVQFVFCLGRCETDDVIFNTLGAVIGSLSYLISEKLNKCRKSKRNMNI